jgi:hypothetical protein
MGLARVWWREGRPSVLPALQTPIAPRATASPDPTERRSVAMRPATGPAKRAAPPGDVKPFRSWTTAARPLLARRTMCVGTTPPTRP